MNNSPWPMVKIGSLLKRSKERVEILPHLTYKQVTVRLWGEGVILRNEVSGTKIRAKTRYVARPGQFILSRIDARNGAMGLVPDHLDGAVLSNDFPVFDMDHQRLAPRFLEWMSKTRAFVALCQAGSEGTTNRVRLQLDHFAATEIPLPPLAEQRRIVARIEALAAKVEAARQLREEALKDTNHLLNSILRQVFENSWPQKRLSDIASVNMGQSPPGETYNQMQIGLPLLNGPTEFTSNYPVPTQWTSQPTKVCNPGDLLICVRGNTTGKMNWADQEYCIGRGLAALAPEKSESLPKYLRYFLEHQSRIILESARGSTFPNLPGRKLRAFQISLPPLPEQHRIVARLDALQAKLGAVQQHQAATQARLDALLPSILDQAFRGAL